MGTLTGKCQTLAQVLLCVVVLLIQKIINYKNEQIRFDFCCRGYDR